MGHTLLLVAGRTSVAVSLHTTFKSISHGPAIEWRDLAAFYGTTQFPRAAWLSQVAATLTIELVKLQQ
ncbi:hypothetical protein C9E91_05310 [Rhizobium sp. SEMIA4064]|nr:hypothetical protein C9E91_05310 [Rhizobium sp. SEMIA4064]